ncbi:cryptochrome/photolyase family protein [Kiloniella sp. b19]|uniref:cryptochrome/photolyase family protein n=1 Tax=Kiloniella sp. GXU_MW_B19 TaxID=3141326 RepID=UPI0031E090A4
MTRPIHIHWFRQDLRLQDNPALRKAAEDGELLPVFILDDENAGTDAMGAASRVWLHHSLAALDRSLKGHLRLFRGRAEEILQSLVQETGAGRITWTRCYEPWRQQRDREIKATLKKQGTEAISLNGNLLWEPWEISKGDGTPYRVFTPFYRKGCLAAQAPRPPVPAPEQLLFARQELAEGLELSALNLLPSRSWGHDMMQHWIAGEEGAHARLQEFLHKGLKGYKEDRNIPSRPNVSRLSPYLHFGEISPNQVWYAAEAQGSVLDCARDRDHFQSELGWREFSHSLLHYNPSLKTQNLQSQFDAFPWEDNPAALRAWQRGQTGIPIVDAGMRELWQTGYMHNRVRMIVGSFLVKNLLLHWHHGERWFWDTLVDADHANNSASWQWIAGCGADAAPYFRIFNAVTQGEKFDTDGRYTRRFVPELASVPDKWLFKPWEAPAGELQMAGVTLGQNYPHPVVDLGKSRQKALAAYDTIKRKST